MQTEELHNQMRIPEVERGDGFLNRVFIRFISLVSGMRLPDAARIVMYHKNFYGDTMSIWTHAAMRGKTGWTVGERELMAAMTAKWNECPFCINAHGAIASLELEPSTVKAALSETVKTKLSKKLQAAITFLKKLTLEPDEINYTDIRTVLAIDVTQEELEDAIAVCSLFNITVRCANTLSFAILKDDDLQKAAKRMLTQGYTFGKKGVPERPNHRSMAEALRQRVFDGEGVTSKALRKSIGKRAISEFTIEEPYNEIALQVSEAAYEIRDEQVNELIKKTGSSKAAFELIVAAAVSAGLYRWDKAINLLS